MFARDIRRRLMTGLLVWGVGGVGLGGCGTNPAPAEATSDPAKGLGQSEAELYVVSASMWRPATVPVCWENPSSADVTPRQWVRAAVERTWEARSGIRFTGWGTCGSGAPGIRIRINDELPHTKQVGRWLSGMAAGMVLNFTFNNWGQDYCRNQMQHCVDAIAVHEFGHGLGYAHEQNRSDRPSSCPNAPNEYPGDWSIGPWDLNSVMNYCNPTWNNNGNLSPTDMLGARLSYGVPWSSLGGGLAPGSGPAVSSRGAGRLDVFVRGTDNALHLREFNGTWQGWRSLGGSLTSDPAAVSWGPDRVDVFARGTDNSLIHTWFDGSWHAWESLGGYLTSGPAVSSWGSGRLDVFVRGGDNVLYQKTFDGSWRDWASLGGPIASDPAAVSWGPGRIDVFARGTDSSLVHKAFDGNWSGWESLGGSINSAPGVSSWKAGRLDVVARGDSSSLYHLFFEGGWSGWEWWGGELSGAPDAVSWGQGRLDLFYAGPDGALRQSFYNNGW